MSFVYSIPIAEHCKGDDFESQIDALFFVVTSISKLPPEEQPDMILVLIDISYEVAQDEQIRQVVQRVSGVGVVMVHNIWAWAWKNQKCAQTHMDNLLRQLLLRSCQ